MGQACSERVKTSLGSSKYWPSSHTGIALEEKDPTINPEFWNWRHIYVRYCTGDVYTGNHTGPTSEGFYFTGARHVLALITDLVTYHGFAQATDVIITGDSAGGMATVLHVDRFAAAAPKARVVGNPLAGFFLFQPAYFASGKHENIWAETFGRLTLVWDSIYNDACMENTTRENGYLCITGPHGSKYIRSEMFFGQNAYDTAQLFSKEGGTPMGPNHPESAVTYVENFGKQMSNYLHATPPQWGYWLASCYNHSHNVYHDYWNTGFKVDHHPLGHAFTHWWNGGTLRDQEEPYFPPSNPYSNCREWPA